MLRKLLIAFGFLFWIGVGILMFIYSRFSMTIHRAKFSFKPWDDVSATGNIHSYGWLWWRVDW